MVVHLFKHFYPENLCVFRLHRDKKIVYGCSTFIQFSSRSNHIFRYILYYDFVNSCAEGVFKNKIQKFDTTSWTRLHFSIIVTLSKKNLCSEVWNDEAMWNSVKNELLLHKLVKNTVRKKGCVTNHKLRVLKNLYPGIFLFFWLKLNLNIHFLVN